MNNFDYRSLAVLDAVVSCGSFDQAALQLGMSQEAVAQCIGALEDAAGRLLVIRDVPAVATKLGQRLVLHYRHVSLMEAALDIDLGRAVTLPALALAVDGDSLATWFAQALPALLSPPRCQLEILQADSERALRLVREGAVFACVAEAGAQGDGFASGSTSPLGILRFHCVASPAFAGHWFGEGFSAEAVALAPAVMSERKLLARFLAQQFDMTSAVPHHTMPASPTLDNCITGGVAYGLMTQFNALSMIAAGQLVDLAPGCTLDIPLAWHAWHIDTPFTRTLSEHIIDSARRHLPQS